MVRRGCKRSFGPREQEGSCTGAKWGCTGATKGLGGAKDSWETFAPWAQKSQKDLLHPPLTTFGDFPFWGNFPGPQHPKICANCFAEKPSFHELRAIHAIRNFLCPQNAIRNKGGSVREICKSSRASWAI